MRKRMKLVRMNTHEYEASAASANDFIPSSGMEGSAGWEGAWEPGCEAAGICNADVESGD